MRRRDDDVRRIGEIKTTVTESPLSPRLLEMVPPDSVPYFPGVIKREIGDNWYIDHQRTGDNPYTGEWEYRPIANCFWEFVKLATKSADPDDVLRFAVKWGPLKAVWDLEPTSIEKYWQIAMFMHRVLLLSQDFENGVSEKSQLTKYLSSWNGHDDRYRQNIGIELSIPGNARNVHARLLSGAVEWFFGYAHYTPSLRFTSSGLPDLVYVASANYPLHGALVYGLICAITHGANKCKECGTVFPRPVDEPRRITCSNECRDKRRHKQKAEHEANRRKSKGDTDPK